jgi:2-furoyl-CoA dehydrogenase large subunit
LPRTLYAAIRRSPHAHADIQSVDTTAAAALGVASLLVGTDVKVLTARLTAGVNAPIEY